MNRTMAYLVGSLLSISLIAGPIYINTADATSYKKSSSSYKKTGKRSKSRAKKRSRRGTRLAGCHNLSTSSLHNKAKRFHTTILKAARKNNVNPNLIKAVITTESCFKPRAVGTSGEKGLMQIMYATGKRFNVGDRYSPWNNIHGGARYLSFLLKRYGNDMRYAVAAYNTGEGRIKKGKAIPNKDYVFKVMSAYHKFNGSKHYGKRQLERASRSSTKRTSKYRSYKVKRGDSISKIAHRHGLSTRSLIRLNNLKRPYRLISGKTIYLSKRASERQRTKARRSKASGKAYKVKRGDSISKIANRHRLSTRSLIRLNKLKRPYTLEVGETIYLNSKRSRERKASRAKRGKTYQVRKGDTIYSIARKTGKPLKQIIRKNGLRKPYTIEVSQKLKL